MGQTQVRRSFPQLGKARVRKLFVEAAKRKHPCLSTSARNALLLRSDDDGGRERKRIALYLLSSLRRTTKTCEVTNATEAAVIFADDESRQFDARSLVGAAVLTVPEHAGNGSVRCQVP